MARTVKNMGIFVRLLVFNVLTCALVGPILGMVLWGLLVEGGVGPFTRDLAGVWLGVYALMLVGPFGLLVGALATAISFILLRTAMGRRGLKPWLAVGGSFGFLLGATCPLVLQLLGWRADGDGRSWVLLYSSIGGGVGAICGLMIGGYSWRLAPRLASA
jgi:hypothetical protein